MASLPKVELQALSDALCKQEDLYQNLNQKQGNPSQQTGSSSLTMEQSGAFAFLLENSKLMEIPQLDLHIPNLRYLLKGRHCRNIFVVSHNPGSLVVSMDQGFCGIPVIGYQHKLKDTELQQLENYLIKM
jgi:hypothetical protein